LQLDSIFSAIEKPLSNSAILRKQQRHVFGTKCTGLSRAGLVARAIRHAVPGIRETLPGPVRWHANLSRSNNRDHDFVGIFSADNIVQLIDIVDECTEPDDCEYASLSVAGGSCGRARCSDLHPAYRRYRGARARSDALERGDRYGAVWDYLLGYSTCRWKRFPRRIRLSHQGRPLPQRPGPGHVVLFRRKRE
jgi:hypothetical protein